MLLYVGLIQLEKEPETSGGTTTLKLPDTGEFVTQFNI